jgi:hypothetical protein
MSTRQRPHHPWLLTLILPALLAACSLGGNSQSVSIPQGPGVLANPAAGLDALSSYHVTFQQDVTGTLDGAPFERHTSLELTRTSGGVDYIQTISGTLDNSYFRILQAGPAVYRWYSAETSCQGEAGAPRQGEVVEPASLLLTILASTPAGSEILNGLSATHYTFTQEGLALTSPKPTVSGEVWLAEQGGSVVKYTLLAEPPAAPSGEGMQTGLGMTYELSQVNVLDPILLPDTCMAVPLDLPVMPDATRLSRASGTLAYQTFSSAAQVADLYFAQLGELGWNALSQKPASDVKVPLGLAFSQGSLILAINIDEYEAGSLDVDIVIFNPTLPRMLNAPPMPAVSPTPSGPVPTINPATSGLPADVPLYPGATNLQQFNTAYFFDAPDIAQTVADFYTARMPQNGWSLLQALTEKGEFVQVWQKGEQLASLSVTAEAGVTKVVISIVNP